MRNVVLIVYDPAKNIHLRLTERLVRTAVLPPVILLTGDRLGTRVFLALQRAVRDSRCASEHSVDDKHVLLVNQTLSADIGRKETGKLYHRERP
jgi:hypothetical protein